MNPIVIKISGSEGADLDALCDDIAVLVGQGQPIILVHGASAAATALAERAGVPVRMITSPSGHSSRYTDPATLEMYVAAAAGQVNKDLVGRLQRRGVNAIGLSGLDGRLLQAQRKRAIRAVEKGKQRIIRDDYTGKLTGANAGLLNLLISAGYTPVIAPLAIGSDSEPLNVDGDRAAALLAASVHANNLIILANVPGLLSDFPDETSLVQRLTLSEIDKAMAMAEGRMKRKILAAQEALEGGVTQVVFADARHAEPVGDGLAGQGTVLERS
ncbi:MAG: [LysW]-aminoadipate kinase [Halieaceae bacterium]|nr:[LysW]-aminoadipate kinase [Halieaceae bacterium]